MLVGVAGLGKIAFALDPEAVEEARRERLPVAAVEYLESEQPPGPLFNSYNWGGYLIWQARDYPVYVDGRTDLFDDQLLRVYLSIYFVDEGKWLPALNEAGINLVLVESSSPLARVLASQPGWFEAYADDLAVIYARETPLDADA